MWNAVSWIGLVIGITLVFLAYYRILTFLEDRAADALRTRVRRRHDSAWVHPTGVDADEWQGVENERTKARQHWDSIARIGRKP